MRIYFLSYKPAILKLNGLYAGRTDLFERHIEVDLNDGVLAEVVPGENLQPVNFFINDKILSSPPDFVDLYLLGDEAVMFIKKFHPREGRLKVLYQNRFNGSLVTVFCQGEIYLAIEGDEYQLVPLNDGFARLRAEEHRLNGYPVLALWGDDCLVIISHTGRQIFAGEVILAEFGTNLETEIRFETCTAARARCRYAYDGQSLTLVYGKTEETAPPDLSVLHFAFFESVAVRADFKKYLSPELERKAGDLRGYLGEFTGVCVPTQSFFARHPNERAAGLIYRRGENLFEVKYYAVELKEGKIDNIYPVDV